MPTAARVVVIPTHDGPLEIQEVQLPDPGPHQVVVRQFASGICHSQLHQMRAPRGAAAVLGHESTGVVLAAGGEVDHVEEGDTVMVTWVPRDAANAGRPPVKTTLELADGTVAASQDVFTWADHTIADEQYVVKVPADIKKDVTAIIGCAVITGAGAVKNTAAVSEGDSVAVFGVGGVGLSAIAAARKAGANPIIAVDLDDAKLDFARRFGATETINASGENPVRAIRKLTSRANAWDMLGRPVVGADFAFDCIGVKDTMEQILSSVRAGSFGSDVGGTAVLVGIPNVRPELNALDIVVNEKKYIGSIGGSCKPDRDFPEFLRWYDEGALDLDSLVTARFTIDQINEATRALAEGEIFGRAIIEF